MHVRGLWLGLYFFLFSSCLLALPWSIVDIHLFCCVGVQFVGCAFGGSHCADLPAPVLEQSMTCVSIGGTRCVLPPRAWHLLEMQ